MNISRTLYSQKHKSTLHFILLILTFVQGNLTHIKPKINHNYCNVSNIRWTGINLRMFLYFVVKGNCINRVELNVLLYSKVFLLTFIHIHITSSYKNNPPQMCSHLPPLGYHRISLVCIFYVHKPIHHVKTNFSEWGRC